MDRNGDSTRAAGEDGVAKSTAQTAPSGAIVIESPFGASIWSIFPRIAMAANAPVFLDILVPIFWTQIFPH